MKLEEYLKNLTGFSDPKCAGKALARELRARALGASSLDLPGDRDLDQPLSLRQLKDIGRWRRVTSFEFNAPVLAEGELLPEPRGGFKILISRLDSHPRARFSLAHEIGHTFFYSLDQLPPRRVAGQIEIRRRNNASRDDEEYLLEERFCDFFASELLFPEAAAREALGGCRYSSEPSDLVKTLERVSRHWRISVRTALTRLDQISGLGGGVLAVLIERRVHSKSGRDPALRIVSCYPRSGQHWFIPQNQRAASIGFRGAQMLHEYWTDSLVKSEDESRRRGRVFGLKLAGATVSVIRDSSAAFDAIGESLTLWQKSGPLDRWKRRKISVPVTYRFYCSDATHHYCLGIVDVRPSAVSSASSKTGATCPGTALLV